MTVNGVTREAEQSLLRQLRAGDAAGFESIVRSYGGRMLAVARRILRNDSDAQDAVQDALLSAFKAIDRFEGTSSLYTWLHRIVVTASLMKLRTRRRFAEEKPGESLETLLPSYVADGHRIAPGPVWTETGEAALARQETRELVRRSIDQLPETYRTILVLRDIEELDTAEVAKLLDMNPGAVKTRLHRARQALRTLLDPHMQANTAR